MSKEYPRYIKIKCANESEFKLILDALKLVVGIEVAREVLKVRGKK